jgi:putative toxin-antitoxin system antitoxin component (TIGR02293 family)
VEFFPEAAMHAGSRAVAQALGLKPRRLTAPWRLIDGIAGGLPVASPNHLAHAIRPEDAGFKHDFVPKATLWRRRKAHASRLTSEESDRLARIAKVRAHAIGAGACSDAVAQ